MTTSKASLKNTYSTSSIKNIYAAIEKTLEDHHARSFTFEYARDDSKRRIGISFKLEIQGRELSFSMPVHIENVEKIFLEQKRASSARWVAELSQADTDQSYRAAWANLRDWLASQFAMVSIGMARTEEIFLPYLMNEQGRTFFEVMQERRFLLPSPQTQIAEE